VNLRLSPVLRWVYKPPFCNSSVFISLHDHTSLLPSLHGTIFKPIHTVSTIRISHQLVQMAILKGIPGLKVVMRTGAQGDGESFTIMREIEPPLGSHYENKNPCCSSVFVESLLDNNYSLEFTIDKDYPYLQYGLVLRVFIDGLSVYKMCIPPRYYLSTQNSVTRQVVAAFAHKNDFQHGYFVRSARGPNIHFQGARCNIRFPGERRPRTPGGAAKPYYGSLAFRKIKFGYSSCCVLHRVLANVVYSAIDSCSGSRRSPQSERHRSRDVGEYHRHGS
jgi:hypothetical protein